MELSNRRFELIENGEGLASEQTLMIFDGSSVPFKASYSGPNIEYGHVIVSAEQSDGVMLYHSQSKSGDLSAGRAKITLSENAAGATEMTLNWQWLTGDLSTGISIWREVLT